MTRAHHKSEGLVAATDENLTSGPSLHGLIPRRANLKETIAINHDWPDAVSLVRPSGVLLMDFFRSGIQLYTYC